MTKNRKDFIMLPTVDFCFKELMQNPKVRKGFIAALLRISPENIRKTTLQPAILDKQPKDDKCYHTINFRDEETGEFYTDLFELKILELSKLSKFSGETKGDEEKRLEYEAREKALWDYNSQMQSARKQGEKIGQKRGEEIGQERGEKRVSLLVRNMIPFHRHIPFVFLYSCGLKPVSLRKTTEK